MGHYSRQRKKNPNSYKERLKRFEREVGHLKRKIKQVVPGTDLYKDVKRKLKYARSRRDAQKEKIEKLQKRFGNN